VDWAEAYGEDFPFGSIFVAAFTIDETTGAATFHDEYVIREPSPEGDTYSLTVDPDDAESVTVYAVLDYSNDGILASNEPTGVYPTSVVLLSGSEVSDVDIDILAAYYDFTGGGGGGGGGGYDPNDYITISGNGIISSPYGGGACVSMLYDSAGVGPYYASAFSPTETETGAEGEYALTVPKSWGSGQLIGAWDSNTNGIFDPADDWGSWVDETGATLNPLTVGTSDLPDHTLLIPDGSETTIGMIPFVLLAGDLSYSAGYASMPAGASVYVTALKYRPNTDVTVADMIKNSYDYATYTGADLTGSSLHFSLIAPANAFVYLWAYSDEDGDGVLNEVATPVGSSGSDGGRLTTGTSSVTGIGMQLVVP
jgi:hypothetical protein